MNDSLNEKVFDLDSLSIAGLPEVSDDYINNATEKDGKKYVVFLINDKRYAICSEKISEIVRPLPYTTLPNVPEWLLGIANLRGDIISIIDLQNLLELEAKEFPKAKLVVLNAQNSMSSVAFKVDKVQEIVTFPDEEIQPNNDSQIKFIDGLIEHKSNENYLLDVDEILDSLEIN